MNQKKTYVAINLPEALAEKLKKLKDVFSTVYGTSMTYEDVLWQMINGLSKSAPNIYEMFLEHEGEETMSLLESGEDNSSKAETLELYRKLMSMKTESSSDVKMKLHEAIVEVLKVAAKPLTCAQIARGVNSLGVYSRHDGQLVPMNQISARIRNYSHLFFIDDSVSPKKIGLAEWKKYNE